MIDLSILGKNITLDASVLIEILAGGRNVKHLVDYIVRGDVEVYVNRLNLVEAFYVCCRLWGFERASERLQLLLDSQMLTIVELDEVWHDIARCKCLIPISIGDCTVLVTARKLHSIPLFLRPERELEDFKERIVELLGVKPHYLISS